MTPEKLAAWLREDILLRRVKLPAARRRPRPRSTAAQLRREHEEAAALTETKSLAEALEVPLADAVELISDDREGYMPPVALAPPEEPRPAEAAEPQGTLLMRGTVDAYIAAVIELWRVQVAHGSCNTKNPRSAAVRGFLEQRRRQRGRLDRDTFQDRGKEGIQAGYTPEEWLRVQDLLLRGGQVDATANEPQSVLLQRALPELSSVLESTREAILHNSTRLASRLEDRIEALQRSLDALLQGQVPIIFTGCFGAPQGPAATPVTSIAPTAPTALLSTVPGSSTVPGPTPKPGPPVYTALAKAYTVRDVWREWKDGLAGQPAVRDLEEAWGSSWRPGNTVRVQFCRRKVVWDEILARVARGKAEEEAVAELELLRAGRSLNQLVDELKHRRQHHQRARAPSAARGQGRTGRWQLYGRRGEPLRLAVAVQ